MEQILAFFNDLNAVNIYGLIVVLLLAGAIGFPFPEDVTFLAVGYVAYLGHISPNIGLIVGFIAVLTGDSIIYFLGKHLGPKIFSVPILNKIITKKTEAKAENLLHKHGSKFIFISKFIVGLRYSVFFTSGMVSVGYGRFILFDALASSISVPLLVYLAYFNGQNIDYVIASVKHVQYTLLAVFIAIVAILIVRKYFKKADDEGAAG
ncbi:MAG: DedA family protein [Proteobacteria bacterium]|nr:DedA family protein [Pseudomonadota bacterium]